MKKMSETIVFFGSGPVAADSLRLLAQDFVIEAVVTKPRPAHHKGTVPVLAVAEELGLTVMPAKDKAQLDEVVGQKPFQSQLAVLIDFGIIVSQQVIDYFPKGIINSHFSLLPEWRGADPITFAILSGQPETGVSLMLVVEAMDEGPLLAQQALPIRPEATTPTLTAELIQLSHNLLITALPAYMAGNLEPSPQPDTEPSHSRKLTKEDGIIDWTKPAQQLEREVRAYAGWPRSRTTIGTTDVVITKAHIAQGDAVPGTLWLDDRQLGMHTPSGVLVIDALIPAGKKEMSAAAFLAGYQPNLA